MAVDLKRMHYFCTVVEQGQVSRAARVLHMAQPPLSQRLRELENELGTPLFLRQGRELKLTEAGALFYRRARDILRAVESSKEEVIRVSSQGGPALRMGLSPTCRSLWLSLFSRLRDHFPEYQMGLVVGDSSYLEQLLQTGRLDVALMQPPLHPENFVIHRLAECPSVAVVPRHLLASPPPSLSLLELSRYPLLLLRRSVGVGSYEHLLRRFHEAGLVPNVALYSSDGALLLDLLAQGFAGIAIVPETGVGELGPAYWRLPLEVPLPGYAFSLVGRPGQENEALLARLLDVLAA